MTVKPMRKKPKASETGRPQPVLEILQELTHLGRDRDTSDQMAVGILNRLQGWVGFDAATLFIFSEEKDRLEEAASIGERVDTLSFLSMGHGQGLAGWSSQSNRPVLLSNRTATIGFNPERDFGTFASLPLPSTGGTIGALNLGWRATEACDEQMFEMLLSVADQVGLLMECTRCRQRQDVARVRLAQVLEEHSSAVPRDDLSKRLISVREFTSTLKYLINDPLSVIVGNAQCLLAEETTFSQKHVSRLRRIEEAALRINQINDKLRQLDGLLAAAGETETALVAPRTQGRRTLAKR